MSRKLAFVSLLGVGLLALAAHGQQTGAATLNGTVTDPSGAAVPASKVTVSQTATGLARTTETTGSGLYSFPSLPAGVYSLTAEKSGFNSVKAEMIELSVGSMATLDFKLQVGSTSASVDVTEEVPSVETTRSQTSTVINSASTEQLPIKGRNILDIMTTAPGVVVDPTRTGDFSFGGQRGTANSLQVDGSDANNTFFGQATGRAGTGRSPYSFSQDAVKEYQVSVNGYAAEIGRAGGGVLNVITKSGTNDFHGTLFEFFRDKGLNANSWENNRAGLPKRNYHFNQFGGNLGGPVVKNKVFFFFDYDGQRNQEPITVIPGASAPLDAASQAGLALVRQYFASYNRGLNNDVYLGKVDWNVSGSQRLSIRYNANRFTGLNYENSGGSSAVGHTGNATVSTDNISGTHTWVISPRTLLESRFTFTRDNEPGEANSSAPEVVLKQGGTTVINFGRNNFSPRYTNAKTYQWAESISHVRGRHNIKTGLDLIWQKIDNFFPGNFSGSFTFNSYADFANNRPFQYTQAFAGGGTGALSQPNSTEYGFYVQDSWRVTERLTLNYGVRYDLFNYLAGTVKNSDPTLAAARLDTTKIPLDGNNVAPRLGFAYKLANQGNLTLRGGYGIFYGRTPSILTGTAITQNGIQVATYTLSQSSGLIPDYPNILSAPPPLSRTPDIYVFDPSYVQPLTHQWSANLERQFGHDYVVTLGYLGVRGEHLTRTRDINLLPAVPLTGSLPDGTAVTYLRHTGRVNPAFGRISLFDSGADSTYNGGFIQLTRRMSRSFQMQTSYTWAHAIDDKPDFTSVVVGTDDSKNAQDTLYPNTERGRANADIRHRFVLSGVWDIEYGKFLRNRLAKTLFSGYQFSIISTLQSGRPLTAVVGSGDPNNDQNSATDRFPGIGRNTVGGPGYADVDIRFSRSIALYKERVVMRLVFEAFNLTNRVNFSNLITSQYTFNSATRVFTPNATFLTPPSSNATSDPRILQLAAKITF